MKEIKYEYGDEPDVGLDIEWGGYNTLPTPYHELSLDEALIALHTDHMGAARFYASKQCPLPGGFQGHWNVTLHVWRDKVIAVCKWYDRIEKFDKAGMEIGKGVWVQKRQGGGYGYFMRFFRIGCQHPNLKELSQEETKAKGMSHYGMHDHYDECPDCGFAMRTDSSG